MQSSSKKVVFLRLKPEVLCFSHIAWQLRFEGHCCRPTNTTAWIKTSEERLKDLIDSFSVRINCRVILEFSRNYFPFS